MILTIDKRADVGSAISVSIDAFTAWLIWRVECTYELFTFGTYMEFPILNLLIMRREYIESLLRKIVHFSFIKHFIECM